MRWICNQVVGFEAYIIDTENIHENLKEIYNKSHCLMEAYKFTENSKFSAIEYDWGFETFIDGKPAENLVKKYFLNEKGKYEKHI